MGWKPMYDLLIQLEDDIIKENEDKLHQGHVVFIGVTHVSRRTIQGSRMTYAWTWISQMLNKPKPRVKHKAQSLNPKTVTTNPDQQRNCETACTYIALPNSC